MALYLSMDGTNAYLKTPSFPFDEVILDFTPDPQNTGLLFILDARAGAGSSAYVSFNANIASTPDTSPWSAGVYIDGVLTANRSNLGLVANQRKVLRLVSNSGTDLTDDINIFSGNNNFNKLRGKIYSVRFLKDGATTAFYDMSTGTVQDQSGNGRHATLVGGTFVDDGVGGGTVITSTYATKQVISTPKQSLFTTKQTIYKQNQAVFSSKQSISKLVSSSFATKQMIAAPEGQEVRTSFQTKQRISFIRSTVFDTKQQLKGRFQKVLEFSSYARSELKLSSEVGDRSVEVACYIGQAVYQPNILRTVSEMEVST